MDQLLKMIKGRPENVTPGNGCQSAPSVIILTADGRCQTNVSISLYDHWKKLASIYHILLGKSSTIFLHAGVLPAVNALRTPTHGSTAQRTDRPTGAPTIAAPRVLANSFSFSMLARLSSPRQRSQTDQQQHSQQGNHPQVFRHRQLEETSHQ